MTDTMSSTVGSLDMALKESALVVDMSPSALMHHNPLSTHTPLSGLKESSPDKQCGSEAPTNLATTATFRCERCDNFETTSRASLLLHVVQCLASTARIKTEDSSDVENLSVSAVGSGGVIDKLTCEPSAIVSGVISTASNSNSGNFTPPPLSSSSSSSSSSRKVFECDVCNMKFSNGANMRRHKMRHTGVKPYECRVCQKRFFRKDHLAEHFTTHTKTLPYHCPICNRGFQRQIAMRAHFQNEHVGHHDLVKTCPLCSYRAGSMKSLRIHFFNRHGIDLDNPGTSGTSSLLLALESQASQVAAAAAAAGFVPGLNTVVAASDGNSSMRENGDSLRSLENATPPMHFLTPHVEISTLSDSGSEVFNGNSASSGVCIEPMETKTKERESLVESHTSLQQDTVDCNTKALPSSTSSISVQISASPKSHQHDSHNHMTPSISLIPIKQEPPSEDQTNDQHKSSQKSSFSTVEQSNGGDSCDSDFATSNNRLASLIKVSPLKSLLREDLKRRICAKANNRITRNAAALENNNIVPPTPTPNSSTTCNSTPICNGTITSSGQESDANLLNRKQILTCLFCGIEFPDETLYFLHKGCHCESNPWKCNICGEQCNNVYEFNSHLLSKSHQ